MLKNERHQFILAKLRSDNKVLSVELSHELSVSEDTVRRDLKELAETGQIRKVHGGAIPRSPIPHSSTFSVRENFAKTDKMEIARRAVSLVQADQVLLLDGGTTNLFVARLLPAHIPLTVFTNSLPVANALSDNEAAEVILFGGKLIKKAQATVGIEVVEAVKNIRADWFMLGICSLHHQYGLSIPNREETFVKSAMIQASNQVLALATSDKLETAEPYIVSPIEAIDIVITDQKITKEQRNTYEGLGVEIMI